MKKILLLMICACLLLAGCKSTAPTDSTLASQTESPAITESDVSQNQYLYGLGMNFCETDSLFCGSDFFGDYLHYYDKETGISDYLCADPTCPHNTNTCSAYISEHGALSICDNTLYWVSMEQGRDNYLWSRELNGNQRKKIKTISFEDIILPYQPQQYVIYGGKLWILGNSNNVVGAGVEYGVTLLATDLDSSSDFKTLFEESIDRGVQYTMRFWGNSVYLGILTFSETDPSDFRIIKYDIDSLDSEIVYEEASLTEIIGEFWITEKGEIYLPGSDENNKYLWRLENGERMLINAWEDFHNASQVWLMNGIVVNWGKSGNTKTVRIMDFSGNILYSGSLFSNGAEGIPEISEGRTDYSIATIGGDTEKLIINIGFWKDTGMTEYTVLLDLQNNLQPTVLWMNT